MSVAKIGDYTVTRELGQGGMGKVYLASSPQGQTVAVKTMILAEGLDARTRWETVERFQREARAARSLVHPSIVQVLDIGADEDTFFIVMEYLEGQTLRELLQAESAPTLERSLEIVTSVCEALAYAHDQGIVHRDIKPDNVMLLRDGSAKLMDFGLAAIVTENAVTQTGTVMGTFAYMSPEHVRGDKLDARSDIFSLGSTFYEMLTGQQPFQGENTAIILNKILNHEPAALTGPPPQVSRIVMKCLRKQPAFRFQNAREIIFSLKTATGENVQRTAVMPGQRPPQVVRQSLPSARLEPIAPTPAPEFRCTNCGEKMKETEVVCWACGAPNSKIKAQSQQKQHQQQLQQKIDQALNGLIPSKKGGKWRRR